MKKLIIKTCIITLIIILAVGFSFFWLVSIASPKIIADTAFKLNAKTTCINYSEKQYKKSESVDDLAILVERTAWANEYELTTKYAPILLSDANFSDYVLENKDDSYEKYIASLFVESLYKTGNKDKSIEVAFSYYSGESGSNTVRIIILTAKSDTETLTAVLKKLKAIENKTEETNYLIEQINNLIK